MSKAQILLTSLAPSFNRFTICDQYFDLRDYMLSVSVTRNFFIFIIV